MDSPRPAHPASRFGPAFYIVIFVLLALALAAAGAVLHAQTPADPAWRTCAAPSGKVCLAVDVTTEIAANPVTGLPKTVQYLKGVKVTASWSRRFGGTQTLTQTTNTVGRVTFQVPTGRDIALRTDTTGMLVSVTNPTTGAPEGHAYVDKTQAIDQTMVQQNVRAMILLSVNPAVAIK